MRKYAQHIFPPCNISVGTHSITLVTEFQLADSQLLSLSLHLSHFLALVPISDPKHLIALN